MKRAKIVKRSEFEKEIVPDNHADTSYLEQDEFEDRLKEYQDGGFNFIGVRASCKILIPHGDDGTCIIQRIQSPGLWGVEDDSGADYFDSVFAEESNVLASMLKELGYEVVNDTKGGAA